MPPSAKNTIDSPSINADDLKNSFDRRISAIDNTTVRSRKARRRRRRVSSSNSKYDPWRSQQRRPTCRLAVEFPPWYAVGSPRSSRGTSPTGQGRLRVYSHLPIWQSEGAHQMNRVIKVYGQCSAASTSTELFGSSRSQRSGSMGLTVSHILQQRQYTTLSLTGIQPEHQQQDPLEGSVLECSSGKDSNMPYLDSKTSKWQQLQLHQPHILGSIFHTTSTTGGAKVRMGGSWGWPMSRSRGGPVGSVSVSRSMAVGWGLDVQAHLATRVTTAAAVPSSLDCAMSVSPTQTSQSNNSLADTTTTSSTGRMSNNPHHQGAWWNLRLGSSLHARSGWRPQLLQLRLAARQRYALLLSWGGSNLNCRCDCTLLSSPNWRLSVLLWSSGGLRWTLACGQAVTLQLPIYIGTTSSLADWWWTVGGSLALSFIQYLLDRTLQQRPSSATRSIPRGSMEQTTAEQQQRAQTQQRLMKRQASRQTTWERERQGLVIEHAVYYSTTTIHKLDVTIPLQFWVHNSTLRLYTSAPRRHMLGFCALDGDRAVLRVEYTYGGARYSIDGIAEDEEIALPTNRARPAQQTER